MSVAVGSDPIDQLALLIKTLDFTNLINACANGIKYTQSDKKHYQNN